MTPKYPIMPDRQTAMPQAMSAPAKASRGKARANNMSGIKKLIAIASVATTVGGWALFAGHDAASVSATQNAASPTDVVAQVSQLTTQPTASATAFPSATPAALATATTQATQQAIVITTQSASTQPAATATTAAATATATDVPAQPTATATTAAPTATTQVKKAVPTAVTTTRSSK
jgi:cytoskeletal protein RodZ